MTGALTRCTLALSRVKNYRIDTEIYLVSAVFHGSYICEVGESEGSVYVVPGQRVCDGFIDCFDGSDEMGCSKLYLL